MPQDDYSATSSGALKLKGVNSKVSKSHKKKRPKPLQPAESSDTTQHAETGQDKNSGDEILGDPSLKNKNSREVGGNDDRKEQEVNEEGLREDVAFRAVGKTEAERRHEERRRRRLNERLKREGIKTHKERVEELNRYLSNLSEHHDMPRIGPG